MSGVALRAVSDDEAGMRLDRWFRAHYPALRHGQLEKMLRKGEIRVDGGRVKANRRLEAGETIRVPPIDASAPARGGATLDRAEARRRIAAMTLFEDAHMLALNKPFGLAVQGGSKTTQHVDGLLAALGEGEDRPRLVHRLDKDTGGLLLVAKTRKAAQRFAEAFKRRAVVKDYWALLAGAPQPREGSIDLPLAKSAPPGEARERMGVDEDARRALTHFQTIEQAGPVAFVAMRPITGRTHQLRVHAAAMERPIVGDGKYGGAAARIEGVPAKLHLFCREMTFPHPATGRRMRLTAPLTGHMAATWAFFGYDLDAEVTWPEDLT